MLGWNEGPSLWPVRPCTVHGSQPLFPDSHPLCPTLCAPTQSSLCCQSLPAQFQSCSGGWLTPVKAQLKCPLRGPTPTLYLLLPLLPSHYLHATYFNLQLSEVFACLFTVHCVCQKVNSRRERTLSVCSRLCLQAKGHNRHLGTV